MAQDHGTAPDVDDIDLEDLDLWVGPPDDLDDAFARLRARPELTFHREVGADGERFGGYWALTRHAEIVEVSRRPEDFSSAKGSNIVDMPPDLTEFFGSIIAMDDPRHSHIRKIVARGFTPRKLDELKSDVESIAAELVSGFAHKGEIDFVTEFAALLPLRVIMDLMGIPRSEEQLILDCTNALLGNTDPEYVPDQTRRGRRDAMTETADRLSSLLEALSTERLANPGNDLVTTLLVDGAEGDNLTPQELTSFFILLVGAGNETTRNAIAHGLLALTEHPDQRDRWQADFEDLAPTAVEEIVRWASPVCHMRRTVTADGVRLGDHEFAEGDKVVMWHYSGNRDDAAIERPDVFDLGRKPNNHVAYGAPGPHYCLGAHLARREITVAFRELFHQLPDIRAVGEPDRLRVNFLHGIKHLRAEFTPAGSRAS